MGCFVVGDGGLIGEREIVMVLARMRGEMGKEEDGVERLGDMVGKVV